LTKLKKIVKLIVSTIFCEIAEKIAKYEQKKLYSYWLFRDFAFLSDVA